MFRSAYSVKERVSLSFPEGFGRTKQSFKDDADINVIVRRFLKGGYLPPVVQEPRYGDVTGLDFQTAQLLVAGAQSQFEELPSAVRARFKNDPVAFLDFVSDPANGPTLIEMGLATAPVASAESAETVEPVVPVVAPAAPQAPV